MTQSDHPPSQSTSPESSRDEGDSTRAGGRSGGALHAPVLLQQVTQLMAPRDGGRYCDGTLGYGGHSGAILQAAGPTSTLWGIDRDPNALAFTRQVFAPLGERVQFIHAPFSQMKRVLSERGALPLDGCLVDLGVSSPQLDQAERGFSFRRTGPLDMRMDPTSGKLPRSTWRGSMNTNCSRCCAILAKSDLRVASCVRFARRGRTILEVLR